MTDQLYFRRSVDPVRSLFDPNRVPEQTEDQRVADLLSRTNPNPEYVSTVMRHWRVVEDARRKLGLP